MAFVLFEKQAFFGNSTILLFLSFLGDVSTSSYYVSQVTWLREHRY